MDFNDYVLHHDSRPNAQPTLNNDNIDAIRAEAFQAAKDIVNAIDATYYETFEHVKISLPDSSGPIAIDSTHRHPHPQPHYRSLIPHIVGLLLSILTFHHARSIHGSPGSLAPLIPLLLVAGEAVLGTALSVCAASASQDSVHFGCGWVSWSLGAVVAALGCEGLVVRNGGGDGVEVLDLETGEKTKVNLGFVLGRVVRDLQLYQNARNQSGEMRIDVYESTDCETKDGHGELSWRQIFATNWLSTALMLVQLPIAIAAYTLHGDPIVLMVFSSALFLMEGVSNMPCWARQKFGTRTKPANTTTTTTNVSGPRKSYAFINKTRHTTIIRNTHLLPSLPTQYNYTRTLELPLLISNLTSFSILAIASVYLPDTSAAYLLSILTLGTMGNIRAAALARESWMHGIPLRWVESLGDAGEMEQRYSGWSEMIGREFGVETGKEEEVKEMKGEILEMFNVSVGEDRVGYVSVDIGAKELELEMEKAVRGR